MYTCPIIVQHILTITYFVMFHGVNFRSAVRYNMCMYVPRTLCACLRVHGLHHDSCSVRYSRYRSLLPGSNYARSSNPSQYSNIGLNTYALRIHF